MFSPSRFNIISKIKDSNNYFLINSLYKQADILDEKTAKAYLANSPINIDELITKKYFVEPLEEEKYYRTKYLDFNDNRENDEVQLFFVPTYACNFNCSYCYQDGYGVENNQLTTEVVDDFFSFIRKEFFGRAKYITLFGGEPLLNGSHNKKVLTHFFSLCKKNDIPLAIVTNGYFLNDYLPQLIKLTIKEIQVTLDGTKEFHDKRRNVKDASGSFDRIVEAIDNTLKNDIPVNLRMVIDKDNLSDLPALADFCIEKKWVDNPLFKTQLGRNYELHYCNAESNKLFSRVELYAKLYDLIKQYQHILKFHQPAYSVSKFLFEQGDMPDPLFDACPGCKTEWAFDFTGNIYACTATVGKKGEELGTFSPQVVLNEAKINEWQNRDVLSINECKQCYLQLACGGGCAAVAKNKFGVLCKPDCRPVKELLEMGFALYHQE
jgi:uncharacterized protein